jgi:hypothetical protein
VISGQRSAAIANDCGTARTSLISFGRFRTQNMALSLRVMMQKVIEAIANSDRDNRTFSPADLARVKGAASDEIIRRARFELRRGSLQVFQR